MPTIIYNVLSGSLLFLAALTVVGTALSLLPYGTWWMRAFDFPRYQLAALSIVSIIGLLWLWWPVHNHSYVALRSALLVALIAAGLYQGWRMIPYTPINAPMGADAQMVEDTERQVSIMVINVYQKNEKYDKSIDLIRKTAPDMVLGLETDGAWVNHLDTLQDIYPHRVAVPRPNTYGMVLYSRLPLHDTHVRYLVQDDVPSIRTGVRMHNGEEFIFYGLHPRPPSPQESNSSTPRDAELVLVAKEIAEHKNEDSDPLPVVVAGDMNDVAWSDTTQLFLKLSGMFDPRIGRGLFNTFHANIPPLRVPLDHVFHSSQLKLVHMRRMPHVGSDHFPIYVRLGLEPEHPEQEKEKELELDEEDVDKATRTVDEAEVDMDPDAFHDRIEEHRRQKKTRDVIELQ